VALTLSINQPAYLPWLGYFDRIVRSDLFVFLDPVQFERNSFINRNRIKTPSGPLWLTVPVLLSGHLSKTINDIEIDDRQPWRRKHLRSIEQNYRSAPEFEVKFARLATCYPPQTRSLAQLCFAQLKFWLNEFEVTTPVVRASEISVRGRKSDLVLDLCHHFGASIYLSGPLGREYLQEDDFAAAGIELRYHSYIPAPYPQLYGDFLPALGVVDYWMNCVEFDAFRTRI
jgi:hypothetical protein